jgi:hypothetical protein
MYSNPKKDTPNVVGTYVEHMWNKNMINIYQNNILEIRFLRFSWLLYFINQGINQIIYNRSKMNIQWIYSVKGGIGYPAYHAVINGGS